MESLYRNSSTFFRTVPLPTPYGLLFPKIAVHNPNPKLQSLLSQEWVKLRTANLADTFTESIRGRGQATNFKFCVHIHKIDRNKSPLKCQEKWPWAYSETLENLQRTIYRAHCAIIFAIAQLPCI